MHRIYNFNPGTDNGNVITITDCQHSDRTQNFDYDTLNRIKDGYTTGSGTMVSDWGETYSIDAWGNLTTIGLYPGKHNSETLNQAATTLNQLTGYSYDAAGNMTQNGSVAYTYDAENRITTTSGYSYVYDGDGERVIKCSGTYPSCATGTLYWRGNAPDALTELTFAGAASEEYTFFGGKRVARRDGTGHTVHYYFSDHLGSTDLITGTDGGINKTSAYYPYGGEISVTGPTYANNYKFTGKERDAESGLDYFGARHYASPVGRWMVPDWAAKPTDVPYANFGNPQSLNLYSYVQNNPTTVGDPDGHIGAEEIASDVAEELASHPEAVEKALAGVASATEAIEVGAAATAGRIVGGAAGMYVIEMISPSTTVGGDKTAAEQEQQENSPPPEASASGAGARSGGGNSGTIYKVPGEATQSGKPYIGRHNQADPATTRKSADGRDRTKAQVVETYDAANKQEGRVKEQKHIDQHGLKNLDNKRNEIRKPKKEPGTN